MKTTNMAKIMIALVLMAALVLLITACGPTKADQNKAIVIGKLLKSENVSYLGISSNGDEVEIVYEASGATRYDAQLVSDWASIFAAAANFEYEKIIIVNTINGEPTARITTSSENVGALGRNLITEQEFWDAVEIKAEN